MNRKLKIFSILATTISITTIGVVVPLVMVKNKNNFENNYENNYQNSGIKINPKEEIIVPKFLIKGVEENTKEFLKQKEEESVVLSIKKDNGYTQYKTKRFTFEIDNSLEDIYYLSNEEQTKKTIKDIIWTLNWDSSVDEFPTIYLNDKRNVNGPKEYEGLFQTSDYLHFSSENRIFIDIDSENSKLKSNIISTINHEFGHYQSLYNIHYSSIYNQIYHSELDPVDKYVSNLFKKIVNNNFDIKNLHSNLEKNLISRNNNLSQFWPRIYKNYKISDTLDKIMNNAPNWSNVLGDDNRGSEMLTRTQGLYSYSLYTDICQWIKFTIKENNFDTYWSFISNFEGTNFYDIHDPMKAYNFENLYFRNIIFPNNKPTIILKKVDKGIVQLAFKGFSSDDNSHWKKIVVSGSTGIKKELIIKKSKSVYGFNRRPLAHDYDYKYVYSEIYANFDGKNSNKLINDLSNSTIEIYDDKNNIVNHNEYEKLTY